MSRARDEEGVVLILVLTMVVLTIGTVYAFARTSLMEIRTMQHRMDRVRADLLARSGVDLGRRALQDDGSNQLPQIASLETAEDPWQLLGEQPIEVPGEGTLRVRVRDAGQRLNLNGLVDFEGTPHETSRPFLLAGLDRIISKLPGRNEEKLYDLEALADGLLDWLDRDELTRLGDKEASAYAALGSGAPPANRPLLALQELADVPGVDDRLLIGLQAYFTVLPPYPDLDQSGINPNTAPPHVLSLIFQGPADDKRLIDEDDVFRILRARDEGRIFCPQSTELPCESFASEIGRVGEPVFPPLSYSNDVFSIQSEASFGDARACVQTVVDRALGTTLSYRLDC